MCALLPRLAGDEVLGDHARLARLAGHRDRRRRAAPAPRTSPLRARRRRRPRRASAARELARTTRGELLQMRRRLGELSRGDRGVGHRVDARRYAASGLLSQTRPAVASMPLPQRRDRGASSSRQQLARRSIRPERRSISTSAASSTGIVAGRLPIEIRRAPPAVAGRRQPHAPGWCAPSRSCGLSRTACRSASSASAGPPSARRSSCSARKRIAASAGCPISSERRAPRRAARRSRPDRASRAGRRSRRRRRDRPARAARGHGREVAPWRRRAAPASPRSPPAASCVGFVVRLDLEDLLVERGGLRVEALVHQVVGDAVVLRERLVRPARRGRRGRRACWRCSSRAAGPRRLVTYSAIAASSLPCRSSFSAFFSALRGRWPRDSPQGRDAGERPRALN